MSVAGSKPPSNVGCVVAIIALPFVLLIGVVVGTVLRNDGGEPKEDHVTLDQGEADGTAWRVDAVRDVEGETCVFLYEGDAEDPLNGTCDLEPQDVTYGDRTIVFGRTQPGPATASVQLSDDHVVDIATQSVDGMDGLFYVQVVDGDVDAVGLAG